MTEAAAVWMEKSGKAVDNTSQGVGEGGWGMGVMIDQDSCR